MYMDDSTQLNFLIICDIDFMQMHIVQDFKSFCSRKNDLT
jgi:hypothetical protein